MDLLCYFVARSGAISGLAGLKIAEEDDQPVIRYWLLLNHGDREPRKTLCKQHGGSVGAIEEAVTNKVGGERIRDPESENDGPPPVARPVPWARPIATLFPFNMLTLTADIAALLMKKLTLPCLGVRFLVPAVSPGSACPRVVKSFF